MRQNIANNLFYIFLWVLFAFLLGIYFLVSNYSIPFILNRKVFLIGMIILCSIYIINYRKHNLFCFETIFFALYILSTFFKELIVDSLLDNSVVSSVFYTPFPESIESKGLLLQTLALLAFLLGSIYRNNKINVYQVNDTKNHYNILYDFKIIVWILSFVVLLVIILLFFNGTVSSWFHYSQSHNNYTNEYIVYLTVLFLVLTIFEFSNLYNHKCHSFSKLLRSINKIYLFDILTISVLLLISGNRNESLLIILPPILSYSIFIKKINNKQFLLGLLLGIGLMVVIGVTRHSGVSMHSVQNSDISLFEASRDFGLVNKNTNYLIEYTDKNKPVYFKNAILTLFSSVPFMGGVFSSIVNFDSDFRSTQITTDGMQSMQNIDSGLGTSLIGDLYYTGSLFFVLIYMFFLGWLLSYLYTKFIIKKEYNMWLLVVFLFLMSNVVYCIRAEWTMPFRYIGFSMVVMLVSRIFITKSKI